MPIRPAAPTHRKRRQRAQATQRGHLPTPAEMCANLRAIYKDADPTPHRRRWYKEAHLFATTTAEQYNLTTSQVAGIIAALSPSTNWDRNLTLTRDLIETRDCSHAYGACTARARRILDGEDPRQVLGGRKTRSFHRNIEDPDRVGAVTIDRHAFSIAVFSHQQNDHANARSITLNERQLKRINRPGVYQLIAACYRSVARELGITPQELQEITWEHWRTLTTNPNHLVDF